MLFTLFDDILEHCFKRLRKANVFTISFMYKRIIWRISLKKRQKHRDYSK